VFNGNGSAIPPSRARKTKRFDLNELKRKEKKNTFYLS
jgi:hypothetical protein